MSHFYGTLQGSRGEATRCGSKDSGIHTVAASWQGAISVNLFHDEETREDWARVCFSTWHGCGTDKEIFSGPVNGSKPVPDRILRLFAHVVDKESTKEEVTPDGVRVTIPKDVFEEMKKDVLERATHNA